MIMKNLKNIEFTSDSCGRYIYDNSFNFIEIKHPDAPVSRGGVFGDIGPYTYAHFWYDISLPMNDYCEIEYEEQTKTQILVTSRI